MNLKKYTNVKTDLDKLFGPVGTIYIHIIDNHNDDFLVEGIPGSGTLVKG